MDRRLQERLIGGIVVVAAAIIFIPELLSGPKRHDAPPESTNANAEGATRTYTIDLEHKSPSNSPASSSETSAPPPEVLPETHTESSPEPAPAASPLVDKSRAEPSANSPAPRMEESQHAASASEPEKAKSPTPKKSARVGSGWAVQVGSFGTSASAKRIAQQFELKGFSAYTQPVQVGSKTLYRVRLGPTPERSDAEAILKKVKAGQPSAALVSEP